MRILLVVALSFGLGGCQTLADFFRGPEPIATHSPNYVTCHALKKFHWRPSDGAGIVAPIKEYNAQIGQMCVGQMPGYYDRGPESGAEPMPPGS